MKYTQIPTDAFEKLTLNAGVLLSTFDPTTATITSSNIIGATTGGITFAATPTFKDYGDDIDNCPKNMKELKKLESWEAKMSGTFVTMDTAVAKMVIGLADVSSTKVTPRNDIASGDFGDIWWVGDYSEYNGATNGGYCAIKLINALSTGGFKMTSSDKAKAQFAFEFTGHYSMSAQSTVPFEVYFKDGTAEG